MANLKKNHTKTMATMHLMFDVEVINSMKSLSLAYQELKVFPFKELTAFDSLTWLDLSNNSLLMIPGNALARQSPRLCHLDISYNRISCLDDVKCLGGMVYLESLMLEGNPLPLSNHRIHLLEALLFNPPTKQTVMNGEDLESSSSNSNHQQSTEAESSPTNPSSHGRRRSSISGGFQNPLLARRRSSVTAMSMMKGSSMSSTSSSNASADSQGFRMLETRTIPLKEVAVMKRYVSTTEFRAGIPDKPDTESFVIDAETLELDEEALERRRKRRNEDKKKSRRTVSKRGAKWDTWDGSIRPSPGTMLTSERVGFLRYFGLESLAGAPSKVASEMERMTQERVVYSNLSPAPTPRAKGPFPSLRMLNNGLLTIDDVDAAISEAELRERHDELSLIGPTYTLTSSSRVKYTGAYHRRHGSDILASDEITTIELDASHLTFDPSNPDVPLVDLDADDEPSDEGQDEVIEKSREGGIAEKSEPALDLDNLDSTLESRRSSSMNSDLSSIRRPSSALSARRMSSASFEGGRRMSALEGSAKYDATEIRIRREKAEDQALLMSMSIGVPLTHPGSTTLHHDTRRRAWSPRMSTESPRSRRDSPVIRSPFNIVASSAHQTQQDRWLDAYVPPEMDSDGDVQGSDDGSLYGSGSDWDDERGDDDQHGREQKDDDEHDEHDEHDDALPLEVLVASPYPHHQVASRRKRPSSAVPPAVSAHVTRRRPASAPMSRTQSGVSVEALAQQDAANPDKKVLSESDRHFLSTPGEMRRRLRETAERNSSDFAKVIDNYVFFTESGHLAEMPEGLSADRMSDFVDAGLVSANLTSMRDPALESSKNALSTQLRDDMKNSEDRIRVIENAEMAERLADIKSSVKSRDWKTRDERREEELLRREAPPMLVDLTHGLDNTGIEDSELWSDAEMMKLKSRAKRRAAVRRARAAIAGRTERVLDFSYEDFASDDSSNEFEGEDVEGGGREQSSDEESQGQMMALPPSVAPRRASTRRMSGLPIRRHSDMAAPGMLNVALNLARSATASPLKSPMAAEAEERRSKMTAEPNGVTTEPLELGVSGTRWQHTPAKWAVPSMEEIDASPMPKLGARELMVQASQLRAEADGEVEALRESREMFQAGEKEYDAVRKDPLYITGQFLAFKYPPSALVEEASVERPPKRKASKVRRPSRAIASSSHSLSPYSSELVRRRSTTRRLVDPHARKGGTVASRLTAGLDRELSLRLIEG